MEVPEIQVEDGKYSARFTLRGNKKLSVNAESLCGESEKD